MKDWVQLQINLYRSMKQEALSFLKKRPKSFLRYERDFHKDQKTLKDSDHRELTRLMNRADTIFIGDFHTLRQSQRLLLRLLRDRAVTTPKNIGLEVLAAGHIPLLQKWLATGSTKSESQLKAALQLESRWGSSFDSYRDLFLWGHKHRLQFIPLFRSEKDLRNRDLQVAKILSQLVGKTWILFGEFHCTRTHLPAELKKFQPHQRVLIIQQNDDRATLDRISRSTLEKTMILKAPSSKTSSIDLFCILHTPLWIKYQSYLEKHLQNPELDEFETLDPHDQITWSLKTLTQFLEDPRYPHKNAPDAVLDFNVFGPDDPNFYKSIMHYGAAEKSSLLAEIKASGVAVLADKKALYLSELTVNSCAQAAGFYLYAIWSGTRFEKCDFFKHTLTEAMSFFMSKILNHSRRAVSWKRWSQLARTGGKPAEAKAVLQSQTFIEKFSNRKVWLRKIQPYQTQSAIALGRNLAEAAFESFLAGEFSRSRLIRLMKTRARSEAEAFEILAELKSLGRPFNSSDRRW